MKSVGNTKKVCLFSLYHVPTAGTVSWRDQGLDPTFTISNEMQGQCNLCSSRLKNLKQILHFRLLGTAREGIQLLPAFTWTARERKAADVRPKVWTHPWAERWSAGYEAWSWRVILLSYSDEVCRNHHQGLPHYPFLHTWYYIIRTRSSEGMAEGCTWWALINGGFGYGSWSVACRAPWKDSSLLLQGGSIRIKNCIAELSCAKNSKIICLNSPGHWTHTQIFFYTFEPELQTAPPSPL